MASKNTELENIAPIDVNSMNDFASTCTSPLQPPHATQTTRLPQQKSTRPENLPTVCEGVISTSSKHDDDDIAYLKRGHRILEMMVLQAERTMTPICERLFQALQERTHALKRLQLIEQALQKQNEAICLRCQKKSDAVMKVHAAVMDLQNLQTVSPPQSA